MTRRTSGSRRTSGNQSEGLSTDFDGLIEGEISIGWEQSGIGLEVTISPSTVELTLGIGIASVTLDLGELNNSSISYAFDIYEIKGNREGCNVRLDYYISGQLVKSENRTIPDCDKEEKEEEKENDRDKGDKDDLRPRPWKEPVPSNRYGFFVVARGGTLIEKAANHLYYPQNWRYRQDTNLSHKISLLRIVHRNPDKPRFSSAAYIFQFRQSGDVHAYDFAGNFNEGTEYYIDKSSRGKLALITGEIDPNFTEQIESNHTSAIIYAYFYGGSIGFPDILRAPPLSYSVNIMQGLHSTMVKRFKDRVMTGYPVSEPQGWNQTYTKTFWNGFYNFEETTYLNLGHEILFEHYFDPPPSEPPISLGKKRCCKNMNKDCCKDIEKLEKMIKQIHKALDVKELLDNNFKAPNRLIAPNGKGSQKLKTYLDIAQYQIRVADHLGIHPFKASLSDANAAQAGNQKVEAQFVSGTAAMRKIVELLLENKGDAAARLNLMVRSAIIQAQILNAVTIAAQSIKSLASFVGMPIKEKLSYIKMPFDISLGARKAKGFDPKKASEAIKINTEAATEEILPKFLQSAEQPYTYEEYDGKQPSLIENIKGIGRKSKQ